ncbi:MAG: TetR/AcrR family transcriptional regulator [Phenylobacterium sp.]
MSERRPMRVNLEARAATAEQRRAQTRDRLLAAAESVIAEKGFDAATIEEFVRAAGVSRGTFYNYFPTATDLLGALNQRVASHLDGLLAGVARQQRDPATLLACSLHTLLAAYFEDPVRGWVALQLAGSRTPRVGAFEDRFARLYNEGVRIGQFRTIQMTSAWTLTFGAMRMIQRDVVSGQAAPIHSVEVVALILAAFGVPYDEAVRISREEADGAQKG